MGISTDYNGTSFRTRLQATWAAFFDLAGWGWEYHAPRKTITVDTGYQSTPPVRLRTDFRVTVPCSHSECGGPHELGVQVGEYTVESQLKADKIGCWQEPSPARFGVNPDLTRWTMCHGHGGGLFSVPERIDNADELWEQAQRNVLAGRPTLELVQ